jgi:hypothetical protein
VHKKTLRKAETLPKWNAAAGKNEKIENQLSEQSRVNKIIRQKKSALG